MCSQFGAVAFESESSSSNPVARKIVKNVLRDGRFQFYMALGKLKMQRSRGRPNSDKSTTTSVVEFATTSLHADEQDKVKTET